MAGSAPQRLKKSWEFRKVYRYGKVLVSSRIVIYYLPNQEGFNRVGFSISKKVGGSVRRHRIKRIYWESYRTFQENIKQGFDFIIVARKGAVEADFHQAREELVGLCRKGRLLKNIP